VSGPLVLKLGGELIETPGHRARVAAAVASLACRRPVAIVHGAGRTIDAAMERQGLMPVKVDGLRVTDAETLDVVLAVLAGSANTRLVSALVGRGVSAVGLTGADAGLGRAARAAAHPRVDGSIADLGLVGDPTEADVSLIELLLVNGHVPVIASLGLERGEAAPDDEPAILTVNADVMACRIAAGLGGAELAIAGVTPGVLDAAGATIPTLDPDAIDALLADGTASNGMVAKLTACRAALADGVVAVRLVDGRTLHAGTDVDRLAGTTITAAAMTVGQP
jgi:acetylglutamate kinase